MSLGLEAAGRSPAEAVATASRDNVQVSVWRSLPPSQGYAPRLTSKSKEKNEIFIRTPRSLSASHRGQAVVSAWPRMCLRD